MGLRTALRVLAVTLAAHTAVGFAAGATTFDQLVVFGDSYSDVGNISTETGGAYPGSPYYQGRYSNGPIWIEDVAASLDLQLLPSLVAGGTDYAYGGAEVTADQPQIPSLATQAKTYLAAASGHADPKALYVIWGGLNDFLIDWDDNPAALSALPNQFAQTVLGILTELKADGATQFLVGEVQDAGKMPAWNWGASDAAAASSDTSAMNAKLIAAINAAKAGALKGATIYILPASHIMEQIVVPNIASEAAAGPPYFGLTNVVSACYDGSELCGDASGYFFWDGVHPTAPTHAAFAQRALALVAP